MQLGLFDSVGESALDDYRVRRHRRARRLSLTVQPSGRVEVLAPVRTSDRAVARFVRDNAEWISATQRRFAEHYGVKERALPRLLVLPALDETLTVRYERTAATGVRARRRGNVLTLRGRCDDIEACRRALQRFVSGAARARFRDELDRLCAETGLEYRRLQVRAQRTCWGSRSCSGTISLNYCALFLKPEVVRYLLIHELCHGRHMNHSRAFWALVRRFEPDYRRLDRELGDGWRMLPGWLDLY